MNDLLCRKTKDGSSHSWQLTFCLGRECLSMGRRVARGCVGLKQMGGGCWRWAFFLPAHTPHSDGRGALDASRLGHAWHDGGCAIVHTCAGAHGLSHHSRYIYYSIEQTRSAHVKCTCACTCTCDMCMCMSCMLLPVSNLEAGTIIVVTCV